MKSHKELRTNVMLSARNNGVSSVLFRNATARRLGINVTDSECLSYLTIQGGSATPTEIARYTGLTSGSVTAMLDRLEKARYVTRKPNPKDRRGTLVGIHPHWFESAGPLMSGIQKAHQELIATYSDDELAIIADFLTRFTKNVTDQTKEIEKR